MLTVMRDYPGGVRSAVLDSPLPPSERYNLTENSHLAQAFEAVLRDCEAQSACRAAYPNLKARLYASLEQAQRSPLTLLVPPPTDGGKSRTGEPSGETELRLGAAELVDLIDTGDTGSLPDLPRLMDQIARRDATALRPYIERILGAKGYAWGMRYSVWCGEEVSSVSGGVSPNGGEKDKSKKSGGSSDKTAMPPILASLDLSTVATDVCRVWAVPPVPKRYTTPVRSKIPTLLIAGEYDPYTPARWATIASNTLPKSRVVTVRGMGHVPTQVWDQPCAMKVAAAFVEAPDRDPARTAAGECLTDVRTPRFKTDKTPP
jgi:pimeloyl-ACP methyl ester carboxylesterase